MKVDEKSVLVETRASAIEIDETCIMTKKLPGLDQDADTIDILTAEVENLKVPHLLTTASKMQFS